MKKNMIFLLLILFSFSLCACKMFSTKIEVQDTSPERSTIDPHVPNKEPDREVQITSLKNSISKLSKLYQKMQTFKEENPEYKKGIRKAEEAEQKYGKRIAEITALTVSDLTDEELEALSSEIPAIFSTIRKVNDLFEFR